jgi:hypothetical protein
MGLVYAGLGDTERALTYLERSQRERQGLILLAVDPHFDRLRTHPRFVALLRQLRLPTEPLTQQTRRPSAPDWTAPQPIRSSKVRDESRLERHRTLPDPASESHALQESIEARIAAHDWKRMVDKSEHDMSLREPSVVMRKRKRLSLNPGLEKS